MSVQREVKDVPTAMAIARDIAAKAGLVWTVVTSARKTNGVWVVLLTSFLGNYRVRIDASTGDILEFGSVE